MNVGYLLAVCLGGPPMLHEMYKLWLTIDARAKSPVPGVPCALPHAHLPAATSHCLMDSTSGVQQPSSAFWETRSYSISHHCLGNGCIISGIGVMCHSLARTGSPQYPVGLIGQLGETSTLPFTVQLHTLHSCRSASLLMCVLSRRQDCNLAEHTPDMIYSK